MPARGPHFVVVMVAWFHLSTGAIADYTKTQKPPVPGIRHPLAKLAGWGPPGDVCGRGREGGRLEGACLLRLSAWSPYPSRVQGIRGLGWRPGDAGPGTFFRSILWPGACLTTYAEEKLVPAVVTTVVLRKVRSREPTRWGRGWARRAPTDRAPIGGQTVTPHGFHNYPPSPHPRLFLRSGPRGRPTARARRTAASKLWGARSSAFKSALGNYNSQGAPHRATTTPRVPRAPADYKWVRAEPARQ